MTKLDDYFDAYDQVHALAGHTPDWGVFRKNVRWSLARPILKLVWAIAFFVGTLLWGIFGHPSGYMLAVGTLLAIIPREVQRLKDRVDAVAKLSGAEELRSFLIKEAERRLSGAVASSLFYIFMAVVFSITGAIAGLRGKAWQPGVLAALALVAFAYFSFKFRWPRVSREIEALKEKDTRDDGAAGGADVDE